jgi:paired amphipathic helix protein Sin3a
MAKKDMFALVQDLFGPANAELFDEFKLLLATRSDYEAHAADMWYATPLSEIDFTQCRKCTPSYRALPKSYPKLQCTDRSMEETTVLNDVVS